MLKNSSEDSFRIALLAGGDSSEREISLASGRAVCAALRGAGHAVTLIDPAEQELSGVDWACYDACFIALHGGAGEDGRVQHLLAKLGVPYTGSGPIASRLGMSKSAAKERFLQAGVPTPPYGLFHSSESAEEMRARVRHLRFPLVVKPDSQGSSLGVSCAEYPEQLEARAAECFRWDPFAIAEPRIDGREFTVAVVGRRPLPVIEIGTAGQIFTYDSKYKAKTDYSFDHNLPASLVEMLQSIAVAAGAALRTSGLIRVDMMLDGHSRVWVLEVNTVPGLTERSLAPLAAARAGLNMRALCEQLIRECLYEAAEDAIGSESTRLKRAS